MTPHTRSLMAFMSGPLARGATRAMLVAGGCLVLAPLIHPGGAPFASAQTTTDALVLRPAPHIPGVIDGGTRPEIVAQGLSGADDPIWLPDVGLVFSEPRANRVVRLDEHDRLATFVGDLHGPLGMTFDAQGRLISLQSEAGFAGPRVIWPAGREMVIADHFEGQPFTRPNDVVADRKGGVYFTDLPPLGQARPGSLPAAVYYVPAGGTAMRVADDIARPNGIQLSRDEKTLYVNDTGGIHLFAFDIQADGRLSNRRVFATYLGRDGSIAANAAPVSNADGLAVDAEGRVYALTEAGIEVVDPGGQHLGVIPVWCITRRCQNLAFGGPEKRTLYVAGGGTLLRIPMLARGFAGRAK